MPSGMNTFGRVCVCVIGLASVSSRAVAGDGDGDGDAAGSAMPVLSESTLRTDTQDAKTSTENFVRLRETVAPALQRSEAPAAGIGIDAALAAELLEWEEPTTTEAAPPKNARQSRFGGILADGRAAQGGASNTLEGALAQLFSANRELAAARAKLRATAEALPQERAALLPQIAGTAEIGAARTEDRTREGGAVTDETSGALGVELNQVLFDGFRGINGMEAARAQILGAEQTYFNLEQTVVLAGASAYMDVLRNRRVAKLRRENLAFLEEQLRAARVRLDIGDGTVTDVAQAESQRALATAVLETALADLAASEAVYTDIFGAEPGDLRPATMPQGALPSSIEAARQAGRDRNPAIRAAAHAVREASARLEAAKGGRLPSVNLTASVQNEFATKRPDATGLPGVDLDREKDDLTASVGVKLSVPFYQGGRVSSQIRQAKETLTQRQIEADRARSQANAAITAAWARLKAARQNVKGYKARVAATQLALDGVIEEREVGQRTTLDVLNAQAEFISSGILLLDAERELVVSGYRLLAAIGNTRTRS